MAKYLDRYDIRRWGAKCDSDGAGGGTDDTAAILACLAGQSPSPNPDSAGVRLFIPGPTRIKPFSFSTCIEIAGVNPAESGRSAVSKIFCDAYDPTNFHRAAITAENGNGGGTLGNSQYSTMRNVALIYAPNNGFNYWPVWLSGLTGITVGTILAINVQNEFGYVIRATAVTTGTTGAALPTIPTHYPLRSTITATSGNGVNPITITTQEDHLITSGTSRKISGVVGNTAANGTFVCTSTGARTFTVSATGNGAYVSGGEVGPLPITDNGVTWTPIEFHGLFTRSPIRMYNSFIGGFPSNNWYIQAQTGGTPNTDASFWRGYDSRLEASGANGMSVWGNDTNAGTASGMQLVSQRGYGIYDKALTRNIYFNCGIHNGQNTIKAFGAKFTDCYMEGGAPPPVMAQAAEWEGGTIGVTYDKDGNANATLSGQYGARSPTVYATSTTYAVGDLVVLSPTDGFVKRCHKANGSSALGATGLSGGTAPAWRLGCDWLSLQLTPTSTVIDNQIEWYNWGEDILSNPVTGGYSSGPHAFTNENGPRSVQFCAAGYNPQHAAEYAFSFGGVSSRGNIDNAEVWGVIWNGSLGGWELRRGSGGLGANQIWRGLASGEVQTDFPAGFRAAGGALGGGGYVQHLSATAKPTTGVWTAPTIIWHSDATAGQPLGWYVTVSGDFAGTPPTIRDLPNIS